MFSRSVRLLSVLGVVSLICFSASTPVWAQDDNPVLAPHRPIAPRATASALKKLVKKPVAEQRSMVGGPWMLDPSMKATLYITNGIQTEGMAATPVLYLSNGEKIVLSAVNLGPAATATVSLVDALRQQGIAPYANLRGYIELDYRSFYDPLCATVVSVDAVHSVIFTYPFRPTAPAAITLRATGQKVPGKESAPQRMDGLWWKRNASVTGFVSVSNTVAQAIDAKLQISGADGANLGEYSMPLAPHATQVVDLRELSLPSATAGGVQLTYNAPADSVLVSGGLQDRTSGYSAVMPFRPSAPPVFNTASKTTTLADLGLMTGASDPMMLFPAGTEFTPFSVIRNISTEAVTLEPEFFWMDQGEAHRKTVPALTIKASETLMVDTRSLLQNAGLSDYNGALNLAFKTKSPSHALMMASGSVDQTGTYVFQVQPHEMGESESKTISYWSVGQGDDTMVTVWNPVDEPQDFLFTLQYGAGGQYVMPLHLQARASRFFNIASLIHDQIPDSLGHVIPASVTEGSASLSGVHAENERILAGLDAGTYNVKKATCSYYCISCSGAVYSVVSTPIVIPFSLGSQLLYHLHQNTGYDYDYTSLATWKSSDSSISSINSGGYANGNARGGFVATAIASKVPAYSSSYCAYDPLCSNDTADMQNNGNGDVTDNTPVLTGIDPSVWPSGATTPGVIFSGQYFGTNPPALTFSPGNGISYSVVSSNDTQIVANVTVAAGTPDEDVQVSVTSNGYNGQGFASGGGQVPPTSQPVYATVQAPRNSPEVTVIGWVDGHGTGMDDMMNNPPSGVNANLIHNLNGGSVLCAGIVNDWSSLKLGTFLYTQADRDYAITWLVSHSPNSPPPSSIDPRAVKGARDTYRIFNDWGGGKSSYDVGITPDPCKTGIPTSWVDSGEPNRYMGRHGTSLSGNAFQLAQVRVGKLGQRGSQTITGRTVPWVWSAIEFDANGNVVPPPHEIFPTYSVYINGQWVATLPQSSVVDLFKKDESNEISPSRVP